MEPWNPSLARFSVPLISCGAGILEESFIIPKVKLLEISKCGEFWSQGIL